MKITLTIFENNRRTSTKVFAEGTYRVGRSENCDIVLSGDEVSRSHIEIRVTDTAVYVTNMSSTGKVKLNQKPIETAQADDGDEIQLGTFKLRIEFGEKEAAAEPQEVVANEMVPVIAENAPKEAAPSEPLVFPAQPAQEPVEYPVEGTAALARSETIVEAKPLVAKLLFVEGPRKGEELLLESYEVNFGRSRKADIFLDDEKLSRIHAKISRVGMGYRLIDLNSRNGTFVNGVRILEHPLSSFDVLELGSTKIKFLIHDVMHNELHGGDLALISGKAIEQTKSLHLEPAQGMPPVQSPHYRRGYEPSRGVSPKVKYLIGALLLLVVLYFVVPSQPGSQVSQPVAVPKDQTPTKMGPEPLGSAIPSEYSNLSPDLQKMVEGQYHIGVNHLERKRLDEALTAFKMIHENLPYYKDSLKLQKQVVQLLKEKQMQEAQQKARRDEKADLKMYLDDGIEYLKEGDFDRAAEAFNSAVIIDPKNATAVKGLKAAEYKIHDIDKVPPDKDPEEEKRKKVDSLFKKAIAALANKSYQEAINTAEKIRQVELKGDTSHLNEAKQIIDRAKMQQKEEFEPFLIEALAKFSEGDYIQSRTLCREMLKRDPAYNEAKECELKAKKQLNRLAKEAYTHGYILESMGRLEDAKQYWNRGKNYVESGDEYYDKIMKKLEQYQ